MKKNRFTGIYPPHPGATTYEEIIGYKITKRSILDMDFGILLAHFGVDVNGSFSFLEKHDFFSTEDGAALKQVMRAVYTDKDYSNFRKQNLILQNISLQNHIPMAGGNFVINPAGQGKKLNIVFDASTFLEKYGSIPYPIPDNKKEFFNKFDGYMKTIHDAVEYFQYEDYKNSWQYQKDKYLEMFKAVAIAVNIAVGTMAVGSILGLDKTVNENTNDPVKDAASEVNNESVLDIDAKVTGEDIIQLTPINAEGGNEKMSWLSEIYEDVTGGDIGTDLKESLKEGLGDYAQTAIKGGFSDLFGLNKDTATQSAQTTNEKTTSNDSQLGAGVSASDNPWYQQLFAAVGGAFSKTKTGQDIIDEQKTAVVNSTLLNVVKSPVTWIIAAGLIFGIFLLGRKV